MDKTAFFILFIMEDINSKLRDLQIEDYIWVIYIFLIILSWYSNSLERKYFLYNDIKTIISIVAIY